jgi:hypothetical protein
MFDTKVDGIVHSLLLRGGRRTNRGRRHDELSTRRGDGESWCGRFKVEAVVCVGVGTLSSHPDTTVELSSELALLRSWKSVPSRGRIP